MHILFATSECVPFFKKGGLGDVSHGLPAALSRLGVSVVVTLPFYEDIKIPKKCQCLGQITVFYKKKKESVFLFLTTIPGSDAQVCLFRHLNLRAYKEESFLFYCLCVSELYLRAQSILGHSFDILHCNDWHTGLIPILLGEEEKGNKSKIRSIESRSLKSIYTIHNLLYDGRIPFSTLTDIGLPENTISQFSLKHKSHQVNLLKEILERVDVVSTVSPTYAREIRQSPLWGDVQTVLEKRRMSIVGILNGIDQNIWNPSKDKQISKTYTSATVNNVKPWNKRKLQREIELPLTDELLLGFIGRIEPMQKGVALICEAIELLPSKGFQIILLGEGDKDTARELRILAKNHAHVVFVDGFNDKLARRIYAGVDVILLPSKFEPCGLNQMIAMRYGTIPLVRRTGGLADSVQNMITGFVFDDYTAEALCRTIWKAVVMREDEQVKWRAMIQRIMKEDFSWERSAKEYVTMYKKLLHTTL